MKITKLLIAVLALLVIASIPAIAQDDNTGSTGSTGSTSSSTGNSGDNSTATTGAGSVGNVSDMDKDFVTKAANGGLMEVQLGKAVEDKAQSPEVKEFAARMVKDHSKANDQLKTIAETKNITLPTDLDAEHKAEYDRISQASGADLDKEYMRLMVKDHVADVNEFRKASSELKDPALKSFAKKTLPVLVQHSKQAQTVAGKVGVDVKAARQEGQEAVSKEKSE